MKALSLCLALSCVLTGCVSQRYVGVQITSTAPMSLTRVVVGGREVVLCSIQEGEDGLSAATEQLH
ncbi:hypothetical protein [Serratia ureilytica]|uniref:Uncharacterized protein n=1 Tax=Serratia ureilytica TaxID=300181 RepID=A0A9X9G069_9GAMM|nr:hypothetical protein [Serratia ureilytica]TXE22194.1 hypothetical protein FOT63_25780 [Serratia ureilytica]